MRSLDNLDRLEPHGADGSPMVTLSGCLDCNPSAPRDGNDPVRGIASILPEDPSSEASFARFFSYPKRASTQVSTPAEVAPILELASQTA